MGATIMPHSLFLGSALATQDRLKILANPDQRTRSSSPRDSKYSSEEDVPPAPTLSRRVLRAVKEFLIAPWRTPPPSEYSTRAQRHIDRENKPYYFVKAHIYHAIADVIGSLLGFAVMINSM